MSNEFLLIFDLWQVYSIKSNLITKQLLSSLFHHHHKKWGINKGSTLWMPAFWTECCFKCSAWIEILSLYNSLCLHSKSACVPINVIHLRTWQPTVLLICYSCWQAHAASAILNFSENCTPEILTPYLDGIVNKLLVLLQVCIYLCWIRFQLASNIFVILVSKHANCSCSYSRMASKWCRREHWQL